MGALALFAVFAADLLLHGPITSIDPAISGWLHAHMQSWATAFLFLFTYVHSTIGLVVMSAAVAVLLAANKRIAMVPWLVLTVQGGQVLNVLVKDAFQRARPHFDDPVVTLATYSFPSGHAAGSTVFWGFVCVLAWSWPARDPVRRALAIIAPLMIAFTAFSRVYLGAHYFSDVLAGISEGVAWVCTCVTIFYRTTAPRRSPSRGA
ncbi:MAG TPA: phosphatase PAP2 family protein [Ramlibacter sp.]|nr:phosphatase PAP2 family protein [Ramlibacter sp.]